MDITVATLIYKSPAYLDFVMNSLLEHPSEKHNVQYLIVCNDATDEVKQCAKAWHYQWHYQSAMHPETMPIIDVVIHENEDPNDWWIQNVYNAWNRCLLECETEAICFVNSDMAFTKGWLDALTELPIDIFIPTSRLVESERMPSLPGLISKNFGQTLGTFNKDDFEQYAEHTREKAYSIGKGAYMPSLFKTRRLIAAGGWHKNVGNMPGDRITFEILKNKFKMERAMVHDSIVYHFQRGESAETGDL